MAFILIIALLALVAHAAKQMTIPLAVATASPISLEPAVLPEYALRTTLRMILALLASLLFTFTYATLAAKVRRAEILLVPILDILQSVPILGFISVTIVLFMAMFPGSMMEPRWRPSSPSSPVRPGHGVQASIRGCAPCLHDLDEASRSFRLSARLRFWRVDVPFAMPA